MLRIASAFCAIVVLGLVPPLAAQTEKPHAEKERKEDIARHRALAAVHEAAAKCLEAGKPEKECLAQLARHCKGLGIGKYCGMKHKH